MMPKVTDKEVQQARKISESSDKERIKSGQETRPTANAPPRNLSKPLDLTSLQA